jgi:hypothetical protein
MVSRKGCRPATVLEDIRIRQLIFQFRMTSAEWFYIRYFQHLWVYLIVARKLFRRKGKGL